MPANSSNHAPLSATRDISTRDVDSNGYVADIERPIAPDQFDPKFVTSKVELRAYYLQVYR